MIVILAVALIVVGPDKLPDLARSLAKGMLEMKKTLNQVKESLTEEDNVLGEVKQDLKKTADELKNELLNTETQTYKQPLIDHSSANKEEVIDLQPVEERPWETDANIEPSETTAENDAPDASAQSDDKTA